MCSVSDIGDGVQAHESLGCPRVVSCSVSSTTRSLIRPALAMSSKKSS